MHSLSQSVTACVHGAMRTENQYSKRQRLKTVAQYYYYVRDAPQGTLQVTFPLQ